MWYRTRNEDKETKETLEKIEGAIKNGQSKDTDNMWYRTRNEDKETKEMLEKIEGAITNGQSKDTEQRPRKDKTQHRRKKKMSNTDPNKKTGYSIQDQYHLGINSHALELNSGNGVCLFLFFRLNLNMLTRKLVLNFSTWLSNK